MEVLLAVVVGDSLHQEVVVVRLGVLGFPVFEGVDERHLLPFLGRNDWAAILTAMEEIDYSGYFTFEVPCKGVLTAQNLRLAYDKLMEI